MSGLTVDRLNELVNAQLQAWPEVALEVAPESLPSLIHCPCGAWYLGESPAIPTKLGGCRVCGRKGPDLSQMTHLAESYSRVAVPIQALLVGKKP